MGKATIINEIGDGQYTIEVKHDLAAATVRMNNFAASLAHVEERIAEETNPNLLSALRLRKSSIEKRLAELDAIVNDMDYQLAAWCADLTEGLTGEVGTIEPGAEAKNGVNIRPGYDGGAVFNHARDGYAAPFLTLPVADALRNFAIMPAIQKHRPTYRYATISNIDEIENTCRVVFEPLFSSVQNLDINAVNALNDVPVEYMTCNAAAFENGDSVIVKWEPYRADGQAKVIGFKQEPRPCGDQFVLVIVSADREDPAYIVWDPITNDYANDATLNEVTWPASAGDLSLFFERFEEDWINSLIVYQTQNSDGPEGLLVHTDPNLVAFDYTLVYSEDSPFSYDGNYQVTHYKSISQEGEWPGEYCTEYIEGYGSTTRVNGVWYNPTFNSFDYNDARKLYQYGNVDLGVNAPSLTETDYFINTFGLKEKITSTKQTAFRIENWIFYDRDSSVHPGDTPDNKCDSERWFSAHSDIRIHTPIGMSAKLTVGTFSGYSYQDPRKEYYWNTVQQTFIMDAEQLQSTRYNDSIIVQLFGFSLKKANQSASGDDIWNDGSYEGAVSHSESYELDIVAQADFFKDGTAGVDPTSLNRSTELESAIKSLYDDYTNANGWAQNLALKIYKRAA